MKIFNYIKTKIDETHEKIKNKIIASKIFSNAILNSIFNMKTEVVITFLNVIGGIIARDFFIKSLEVLKIEENSNQETLENNLFKPTDLYLLLYASYWFTRHMFRLKNEYYREHVASHIASRVASKYLEYALQMPLQNKAIYGGEVSEILKSITNTQTTVISSLVDALYTILDTLYLIHKVSYSNENKVRFSSLDLAVLTGTLTLGTVLSIKNTIAQYDYRIKVSEKSFKTTTLAINSIQNTEAIQANNVREDVINEHIEYADRYVKQKLKVSHMETDKQIKQYVLYSLSLFYILTNIIGEGNTTRIYLEAIFSCGINLANALTKIVSQYPEVEKMIKSIQIPDYANNFILKKNSREYEPHVVFKNISLSVNEEKGNSIQKKNILKEINISFPRNTVSVIVGKSGNGKSTIGKLLSGLYTADHGLIEVNVTSENNIIANEITYIPAQAFPFKGKSVYENITLARKLSKIQSDLIIKLLRNFECGIEADNDEELILKAKEKLVDSLSDGQKKRVSLIRGLIRNTPVFILDEPTSMLDENTKKLVINYIESIKNDKTIIIITHDLDFIKTYPHNVLFVDLKKVIKINCEDLLKLPNHYTLFNNIKSSKNQDNSINSDNSLRNFLGNNTNVSEQAYVQRAVSTDINPSKTIEIPDKTCLDFSIIKNHSRLNLRPNFFPTINEQKNKVTLEKEDHSDDISTKNIHGKMVESDVLSEEQCNENNSTIIKKRY